MSNFKLNLPTDIPWERICVTEDMISRVVCSDRLPAKWKTSIAVFRYAPPEEDQLYPNYRIIYLKVTATITGYQPIDQEIQGEIDWDDINVSSIPGLKDLLNAYLPCHGAIMQVTVGPHGPRPEVPPSDYPVILDFEPKKRELYEMATDTQEKQSRSIESLNVTKSTGNTQSLEVLDIDTGGGGFGITGGYGGAEGGFSVSNPNGQWGTKRVNADESLSTRTSDVGQEKRETFAFSTQLSQMYHLLDSYHLGTNRAVFFVQPRPHTLEEPSGFVRGPRPVDGIQEFFLVVAQKKEQDDFCVSVRLDTSHLTKTPIMDYDVRTETTDLANASADLPSKADTVVSRQVRCTVDYWVGSDDIYYKHFVKKVTDSVTYDAPAGYHITSYSDAANVQIHGTSSIVLSADRKTLTINAEANSSVWLQDEGDGWFADCPDELDQQTGLSQRKLYVNLTSDEKIKPIGEEEALVITTRGLCCCAEDRNPIEPIERVVSVRRIPQEVSVLHLLEHKKGAPDAAAVREAPETCPECDGRHASSRTAAKPDARQVLRTANALGDYIMTETIKSLNDPTVKPKKFVETDFFTKQLALRLSQSGKGRRTLGDGKGLKLSDKAREQLAKRLGKSGEKITRKDLVSLRTSELSKVLGVSETDVGKLKLGWMGVRFRPASGKPAGR
jgi:hypothetical protein